MEFLQPAAAFLREFGLPLGLVVIFALLMISKPKGSKENPNPSPYLVPGSALDAKDREMAALRSQQVAEKEAWHHQYTNETLTWQRLREEERSQRMAADTKLAEGIKAMTGLTDVVQDMRVEVARIVGKQ